MNDFYNIGSLIISILALLGSLYAVRRQFRAKKPEIRFLQSSDHVNLTPSRDVLAFEAYIPLVFVNEGEGSGTVVIKECLGYCDLFGSNLERLKFVRDDDKHFSNVLQISQFSTGSLLAKVGPFSLTHLNLDLSEDWDEMTYNCRLEVSYEKTIRVDERKLSFKQKKKIELIPKEIEIKCKISLTRFDVEKLKEMIKEKSSKDISF